MIDDPYGVVRPRKPSFRGLITYDTVRGQTRVRVWPKKRGKGKTPEERKRAEDFRKANILTKYLPAIVQQQYREAVRGTPLMPRDLLIQLLYGRFAGIGMTDGRKLFPQVARRDISDSLDVLAQVPGDILFRSPEIWQRLPIGEPGQILQVSPEGMPFWVTVEGGGDIASATITPDENTSSTIPADLATFGPSVSLLTGESVLVSFNSMAYRTDPGGGNSCFICPAVTGASDIPADADAAAIDSAEAGGYAANLGRTRLITGLTPGLNTFTLKYWVDGAHFSFGRRDLTVFLI